MVACLLQAVPSSDVPCLEVGSCDLLGSDQSGSACANYSGLVFINPGTVYAGLFPQQS